MSKEIAFVCHPYHRGGVTRWMADAAIAYARKGTTVYFITVEPKQPFFSAGNSATILSLFTETIPGLKIISTPVSYEFEFGTSQYRTDIYCNMLAKYVPANTPVILADELAVWETSKSLGSYYRFVAVLHSDEPVYYNWAKAYGQYMAAISCVSIRVKNQYLAGYATDKAPANVAAIPCGILLPEFTGDVPVTKKLELAYVGRLTEYQKRISDLVRIAAGLNANGSDFHFHVFGDGQKQQLIDQAGQAGVVDRFTFYGWATKDVIYAKLAGVDMVVLTSDFEGMPISMMEGLASGCAVVSTRVSGVEDYEFADFARNCIWVNAVGDIDTAVRHVLEASAVPAEQRRKEARAMAEREFSMDVCLDRYDKLIETAENRSVGSSVVYKKLSFIRKMRSHLRAYLRYSRVKMTK